MGTHEAAVVGGSLAAFVSGMRVEQLRAVKLAALWAESTTISAMADASHAQQYDYYRRQLKYLGWDALSAEQVHWPDPQRPLIVDQALRKIDALAGRRHSTTMGFALGTLSANPAALLKFETRSRQRAQFQLLSCTPASSSHVDLVVYHEAGAVSAFTAGFLFRERSDTQVTAELVRFNTRLFDQEHRSKVERALVGIALGEIHEMQV